MTIENRAQLTAEIAATLTPAEAQLIAERRAAAASTPVVELVSSPATESGLSSGSVTDETATSPVELVETTTPVGELAETTSAIATTPALARPRWANLAVAAALALVSGLIVRAIFIRLWQGPYVEGVALGNFILATVPVVGVYFAWLRRITWRRAAALVGAALALALALNLYPWTTLAQQPDMALVTSTSDTSFLTTLHILVVLWLLVGLAYLGSNWRSTNARMDFLRFTGEWLIYVVLIFLVGWLIGGLVLSAFVLSGVNPGFGFALQLLAAMAVPALLLVAAWLVEATRHIVGRIAPVLTWIFTPIMLVALLVMIVPLAVGGTLADADRWLLILLDAVLIVVLALVVYSISARDAARPPGAFDWLQLTMIALASAMNLVALVAMLWRTFEFGWTPNKTAAIGLNIALLVHLAWTGWLLLGFVRRRRDYREVERLQTSYLPVYLGWAAFVALIFPLIFRFR